MTRRSQKQKTGNSSGSGTGKPHLAYPPATEHCGVVRQIFEALNIQFERLRSDPVMRGQRDPTALHNFAALLNRAVTPVTTEEKIVFETIRYLADANRAKLCRWMFSAHLACISMCADERLVALGLNVPSDIIVAMQPGGTLVIRHSGPSGMSEFNGRSAKAQEAAPNEPKEHARDTRANGAATAQTNQVRTSKPPETRGAAGPAKSGKTDKGSDKNPSSTDTTEASGNPVDAAEPANSSPRAEGETDPGKDAPDGTLAGTATGRKRDIRRPVVGDVRYQQVIESLKAATGATATASTLEPREAKLGAGGQPVAPSEPDLALRCGPTADPTKSSDALCDIKAAAKSTPAVRSPSQAAMAHHGTTPGMPQSYRDAVATIPDCDKKKKTAAPAGMKGAAPSGVSGKPTPGKTEAPQPASTPKRPLSRIEEETELLLDFLRVAPAPIHSDQNRESPSDGSDANRGKPTRSPAPPQPTNPDSETASRPKIASWAEAPSDDEDKEADIAVQQLRQPAPLKSGTQPQTKGPSETKRSVTFARSTGRSTRDTTAEEKKSNRRGGRRRRRRDQSSATSNSA